VRRRGFTFVPLVGGAAATLLGALALKKEREEPSRYSAGGMAMAGVVIGLLHRTDAALFVTLFTAKRITPITFVLVVVSSAYVFHTATRRRAITGQKFAIIGGSIVTMALAIAHAIGLAFGFYFLMRAIATRSDTSSATRSSRTTYLGRLLNAACADCSPGSGASLLGWCHQHNRNDRYPYLNLCRSRRQRVDRQALE
jgi:hypothetical protein